MKRLLLSIAATIAVSSINTYAAEKDISVTLNGEAILLRQAPIIENGRTLVPVREVCEAMNLTVDWLPKYQEILVSDGDKYVKLEIDYHTIDINGNLEYLEAAPALINDITCMPIRAVIEPFGAMVDWDSDAREVIVKVEEEKGPSDSITGSGGAANGGTQTEVVPPPESDFEESIPENVPENDPEESAPENAPENDPEESIPENAPESDPEPTPPPAPQPAPEGFAFYSQEEDEWGFEANGRGYCWVCSYAMLITNLTDVRITPTEIAAYNLEMGSYSGSYMAGHIALANRYGLEFVPAIDEGSAYFDRFETSHRGATYFKAETDEDVKNALIEALERNPDGIMVRFEGYPHTLVATEYRDGEIYFNDPGQSHMEGVTFENTCLGSRFTLSDLSYVQALVKY